MSDLIPSMSIIESVDNSRVAEMLNKIKSFQAVIQCTLKVGHDYDTIPGTNKPTLLKAGAEKINMLFGVNPEYDFLESVANYEGEFFAYTIKCTLFKNGYKVGQGIGSCNSKENKYRWKNVREHDIPSHLDKATLTSKADNYNNTVYKIENDDICSIANTILKMAKKRAFVDATLQLAALSEIFMQGGDDLKDMLQDEQLSNMTLDEAVGVKVAFGKHKGKLAGEIFKSDKSWIEWFLRQDRKDPKIAKAIEVMKQNFEDVNGNGVASADVETTEEAK